MSGEPIWIHCEGSGCPTYGWDGERGMCQMCGRFIATEAGKAAEHQRDDVLARIERGDFDG